MSNELRWLTTKLCSINHSVTENLKSIDVYGLETVVSVLFTNTGTRWPHNVREIFNTARLSVVLKISSSLYSQQERVFVNTTRTNSL